MMLSSVAIVILGVVVAKAFPSSSANEPVVYFKGVDARPVIGEEVAIIICQQVQ